MHPNGLEHSQLLYMMQLYSFVFCSVFESITKSCFSVHIWCTRELWPRTEPWHKIAADSLPSYALCLRGKNILARLWWSYFGWFIIWCTDETLANFDIWFAVLGVIVTMLAALAIVTSLVIQDWLWLFSSFAIQVHVENNVCICVKRLHCSRHLFSNYHTFNDWDLASLDFAAPFQTLEVWKIDILKRLSLKVPGPGARGPTGGPEYGLRLESLFQTLKTFSFSNFQSLRGHYFHALIQPYSNVALQPYGNIAI